MMMMMMMSSMLIFRDLNTEMFVVLKVDKKQETLWKGVETFPAFSSHKLENTLPPVLYFVLFFLFSAEVDLECQTVGFSMRLERCWGGEGFLKLFSYLPNTSDGVHRCLCVVWWFSQAALIQDDLKETENLEVNTWSFINFPTCVLV